MYVVTADQRRSRRTTDTVPAALALLAGAVGQPGLPFERTVGDELQGALHEPAHVVDVVRALTRMGGWSIGIGIGQVEEPLPASTREMRGPATIAAREAVEHARRRIAPRLSVRGADRAACLSVEAVMRLYAAVLASRSEPAWQAVDLVGAGSTHAEAAARLGISRQAVGQRLEAARYDVEEGAVLVLVAMLDTAHRPQTRTGRP